MICSARFCGRFTIFGLMLGILLLATPNRVSAQGQYGLVSEADVLAMAMNHYFTADNKSHDPDFEWTFTKTDFVLKKGKGAIPTDLQEKLLPKGTTADEIRGKWKLTNHNGRQLVLTEIKAGDKAGNKEASLVIYKTAPSVVRVGELQYVFAIGK